MDVLLGFLIGLAYPPMLVIIVASLIAARSGIGVIAGVAGLILLSGPVVWAMTFVALGVGAGFAAFGGWIIGLGLAALIAGLVLVSRFRGMSSRPHSAARG